MIKYIIAQVLFASHESIYVVTGSLLQYVKGLSMIEVMFSSCPIIYQVNSVIGDILRQ